MFLLDTHILLWFISADQKLPIKMKNAIEEESSDACISIASIWEVIIKYQIGKLQLPDTPVTYLREQCKLHNIRLINIECDALTKLEQLPAIHRDPFDRVILAQSQLDDCQLLTVDPVMLSYPKINFFT